MENFVLYEELGREEHSIIYKGRRKGTINFVAIHCIEKCKRPEITNTVRMTHDINHENVVRFYEWYETSNHLWLIVELCTGGSLKMIIAQDGFLPETSIRRFGSDLIRGLHYLHSIGILFCDLHSAKVMLDGSGTLKFADFGLSRVEGENLDELFHKFVENTEADNETQLIFNSQGCPMYLAPELVQTHRYTVTSDLWALGCLFYEMFTGHPPFLDDNEEKLKEKIINQDLPPPKVKGLKFSTNASTSFWHLLKGLLNKDPKHRLNWDALLRHEFWQDTLLDLVDNVTSSQDVTTSRMTTGTSQGFVGEDIGCRVSVLGHGNSLDTAGPPSTLVTGDVTASRPGSVIGDHMRPKTAPDSEGQAGLFTLSSRPHTATPPDDVDSPHRPVLSPLITTRQPVRGESACESAQSYIKSLLYHPSDFIVTQIVDNPKIQRPASTKYDSKTLPVPPYSVDKIMTMADKDRSKHVKLVLDTVVSPEKGPPSQKRFHLLNYLTVLAANETIVSVFMQHNAMIVLSRLIKDSTNIDVRLRLARSLALIALKADAVDTECNLQEVFSCLTELTRDSIKTTALREALLIAIGQLLYLVAKLEERLGECVDKWNVPSMTYTLIVRSLRDAEGVVKHIAAKVLENVLTIDSPHAQKFMTNETAQLLWCVFKNSSIEATRSTAISALSHVTRCNANVFQSVIDTVGLSHVLEHLSPPFTHQHTRLVTMLGSLVVSRLHLNRFIQHQDLVQKLVKMLDSTYFVLRAKVYLVLRELVSHTHEVLLPCCLNRFVTYIERDIRRPNKGDNSEAHDYLMQCINALIPVVIQSVPTIMKQTVSVLGVVQGRQHPPAAHIKQIKAILPQMAIISHLLPSPVFGRELLSPDIIQSAATLFSYLVGIERGDTGVETALGGLAELNSTLLTIVDQLSQQPASVADNHDVVRDGLIPPLIDLISTPTLDMKVARLRCLTQIVSSYLPSSGTQPSVFHDTLIPSLYPQIEQLLLDQDPVPCYTLNLLLLVTQKHDLYISKLSQYNLTSVIFHLWTELQTGSITSTLHHLVWVVRGIVHHAATSLPQLYDCGLLDSVMTGVYDTSAALEQVTLADRVTMTTLQALLDILHDMLRRVSDVVRIALQMKKRAGAGDAAVDAEDLLLTNKPLTDLCPSLIRHACNEDTDIHDVAIKCLSLLVQLYGGENSAAFCHPSLNYYTEALTKSDARKQKVILRIIKRLITTNKDHLECIRTNGDHLRDAIQELAKTASSHADMAVSTLASEIIKTLA